MMIVAECLIYFLVIFTPWAFGATEQWSMWIANGAAYILGALFIGRRLLLRFGRTPRSGQRPDNNRDADRHRDYDPITVEPEPETSRDEYGHGHGYGYGRWLTRLVAGLTLALLAYVLVSLLNARATYDDQTHTFRS